MLGVLSRRGWVMRVLLAEKTVQHAVVTWTFVTDRFGIRDEVVVDWRWLAVIGGAAGLLFAVALVGYMGGRRWSLRLAILLASIDIVGEFVAQGTVSIVVTVSFLVAIAVLVVAVRELRRTPALDG